MFLTRNETPQDTYGDSYRTTIEEIEKADNLVAKATYLWAVETLYLLEQGLIPFDLSFKGVAEAIIRSVEQKWATLI